MIISSNKQFAFIHIPKCAGSNFRNQLKAFEDNEDEFNLIIIHPELGNINTAHLTLDMLKIYYPLTFQKVVEFESVAIIRNPYDRFISSVNQRLREFKGLSQSEISDKLVLEESKIVTNKLMDSKSNKYELELVHFIPQSEFVNLADGTRIVKNIFSFDQLNDVTKFFSESFGIVLSTDSKNSMYNATIDTKYSALKPIVKFLKPLIRKVPNHFQDSIRDTLIYFDIYGRISNNQVSLITSNEFLDNFITDYYHEDFEIYRNLTK